MTDPLPHNPRSFVRSFFPSFLSIPSFRPFSLSLSLRLLVPDPQQQTANGGKSSESDWVCFER
jgi:hypothetical protein